MPVANELEWKALAINDTYWIQPGDNHVKWTAELNGAKYIQADTGRVWRQFESGASWVPIGYYPVPVTL